MGGYDGENRTTRSYIDREFPNTDPKHQAKRFSKHRFERVWADIGLTINIYIYKGLK